MAGKGKVKTVAIKLVSTAGTGFFYATTKNPRNVPAKLSLKKVCMLVPTANATIDYLLSCCHPVRPRRQEACDVYGIENEIAEHLSTGRPMLATPFCDMIVYIISRSFVFGRPMLRAVSRWLGAPMHTDNRSRCQTHSTSARNLPRARAHAQAIPCELLRYTTCYFSSYLNHPRLRQRSTLRNVPFPAKVPYLNLSLY
jgi:ribosomal protein L33